MRLIDADALTFTHDYVTADGEPCITKAVIDAAPTIDAVPVVRCKDCVCWTEWENGTGSCSRFALNWLGTDADDFCSMAEREDHEID